jgi:KaiC/GvpD/RAD55 family RecA-like ATPase
LALGDPPANKAIKDNMVATGVKSFDVLIERGIPEEDLVFLVGHPGSGKTLLSSQFLYNGSRDKSPASMFRSR